MSSIKSRSNYDFYNNTQDTGSVGFDWLTPANPENILLAW